MSNETINDTIDTRKLGTVILIIKDGDIHLSGFKSDDLDAVNFLIKRAVKTLVKTGKSRQELLDFLGYEEGSDD